MVFSNNLFRRSTVPRCGFMAILLQVLRLKPGGLLIGGPPCGTWVFINRGTSRRSKQRVLGDCKKQSVRDSNELLDQTQSYICVFLNLSSMDLRCVKHHCALTRLFFGGGEQTTIHHSVIILLKTTPFKAFALRITARWVLLGLVAAARKVLFVTEQPRSSLMAYYAYVRYMALSIRPLCWQFVSLS